MGEPEDGAARAGPGVDHPPARPVDRPLGARGGGCPLLPARLPCARATSAAGTRIRGANRNEQNQDEAMALVDHASGAPLYLFDFNDDGGEPG